MLVPEELERVVAAVHSREARRAIQMETPRTIWDAGATETGEFWVWRVLFGQSECLACRFRQDDRNPERTKALQLSQVLGLMQDDWLAKLRNNARFTEEDVKSIQLFTGDAITTFALPRVGQRFGDWEVEQCGKLMLPDVEDEIPIPFARSWPGCLLPARSSSTRCFQSLHWIPATGMRSWASSCTVIARHAAPLVLTARCARTKRFVLSTHAGGARRPATLVHRRRADARRTMAVARGSSPC